ncbi:Uncharacterised protein [Vibrio cholerae]|nr:Uncharacterised protein [Vibrio cholerae]
MVFGQNRRPDVEPIAWAIARQKLPDEYQENN